MSSLNKQPGMLLMLTHYFPAHGGGIEIVARNLATALSNQHAFRVTWMASDTDAPPLVPKGVECQPASSTNMIERIIGLPYPLWSVPALGRLWLNLKNSDALILHDFIYAHHILGFLFAILQKKPVLIIQHIGHIKYKNGLLRLLLTLINRILGKRLLASADQTVFISKTVQDYFGELLNTAHPARLVPNGVDETLFYPLDPASRLEARKQAGIHIDEKILLFVGRFVEKKGIELVRTMAERSPHRKWILVGSGAERPEDWCLPNISILRNLQQDQLAALYRTSDLLVLPSHGEGFPLVVQEAMASGTPAIINTETIGGLDIPRELIFSAPCDVENAADRWLAEIEKILATSSESVRGAVAQFAVSHWSWRVSAQKYAQLIDAIVDNKS